LSKICRQLALLLLVLTVPGLALASHYLIQDVPEVIEVKYHKAIIAAGASHTGQLYDRIAGKKKRRAFAKESGIGYDQLTQWARFIDLMRVKGIGPKMVRLFNAAGVETLRSFRKATAKALYKQIRVANRGGRYSQVIPGEDVLRAWIKQARRIKLRLE
jgi:DNA polymerase/3'-5' exonuclease PolX